jgi:hypothetical protein
MHDPTYVDVMGVDEGVDDGILKSSARRCVKGRCSLRG